MTLVLRDAFFDWSSWGSRIGDTIVAGRTGTAGQLQGSSAKAELTVSNTWVTTGFAFKTGEMGAPRSFVTFMTSPITAAANLTYNPNGSLTFQKGASGTVAGTTAAGVIAVNTWAFIELQVFFHTTLAQSQVTIRVNGTQVLNVTTADLAGTLFTTFRLVGALSIPHTFDDLYLATGVGESFRGDTAISEARDARQVMKVALAEPMPVDWYRSLRHTVRVAFQGATTFGRVGGVDLRVLRTPLSGYGKLGGIRMAVLRSIGIPTTPTAMAKYWTGATFASGPIRYWTGTEFQNTLAVKTWNGTAFVDAVGG